MDLICIPCAFTSTFPDPNSIYTFKNPRQQNFSLRWPFIKYILKNPTGKAWKNVIKTCKYFFLKYPLYPVKKLTHLRGSWNADGERGISVKTFSKIWLFDTFVNFHHYSPRPDNVSVSVSEICKCDLRTLLIVGQEDLSWENYKIFCNSNMFKKDTVTKMTKIISGFKDLRCLQLSYLNVSFDLSSFIDFLTKNKKISVSLEYSNILFASKAYKRMLETCFGQLLSNPPKKLPKILIPEFNGKKYREYQILYEK